MAQAARVIASIAFHRFKALRQTRIELQPFNLIIGPNGSGKTSLIESILTLRRLAALPVAGAETVQRGEGPEIRFGFAAPHTEVSATLGCAGEGHCDFLRVEPEGSAAWPALRAGLATVRGYALEHEAMTRPCPPGDGAELAADGANLAAVLVQLRAQAPSAYAALQGELLRLLPEFSALEAGPSRAGGLTFGLRLADCGELLGAEELSQGTLYVVALLALAFDPDPPRILCLEEVDRGVHPRMFREVRDVLYRLSHPPADAGRQGVQVIATTHSPYFIDLFRDHPEEVIISQKCGRAATFERLADRPDLPELLREGSLGEMWYSGILGGVPEER
ncbi:MAG: hypothetical protein RLZZ447_24 [Verrucomicrobiota bacterium]